MRADNQLEQIWQTYSITIDCLKIAKKTVESDELQLLTETHFAGSAVNESAAWLQDSQLASNDFVILNLWTVFERFVIEYIQDKGAKIREQRPSWFCEGLYEEFEKKSQWWTDEVLRIFEKRIRKDLIHDARDIRRYRNWVAHKNPKKPAPSVTPEFAYETLTKLVELIESLTPDNLNGLGK